MYEEVSKLIGQFLEDNKQNLHEGDERRAGVEMFRDWLRENYA